MKKTTPKPILRLVYKWEGIRDAATRLGCSKQHLSEVVRGNRPANAAIARFLREQGIKVDARGYCPRKEASHA